MNRLILTLIITFSLSNAFSQNEGEAYINGGLTLTHYVGDDVLESDFQLGLHGGILFDNIFLNHLRILTGLQYNQFGDDDIKIYYASVPFSIGQSFTDNLTLYAGIQFNLRAKADGQLGLSSDEFKDLFEPFSVGGIITANYTFDKYLVYLQYNRGFSRTLSDIWGEQIEVFDENFKIGVKT